MRTHFFAQNISELLSLPSCARRVCGVGASHAWCAREQARTLSERPRVVHAVVALALPVRVFIWAGCWWGCATLGSIDEIF